jgi:hypothetical protein
MHRRIPSTERSCRRSPHLMICWPFARWRVLTQFRIRLMRSVSPLLSDSSGAGPLASEGLQDADATRPGGTFGAHLPNELATREVPSTAGCPEQVGGSEIERSKVLLRAAYHPNAQHSDTTTRQEVMIASISKHLRLAIRDGRHTCRTQAQGQSWLLILTRRAVGW